MKLLIIGSSGLIGGELLRQSLDDKHVDSVEIWVRRDLQNKHSKLQQKIIDFENIGTLPKIDADAVCISLGSTIKKAGSKEAFRKVDYDYVVNAASLAEKSAVKRLVVISSLGANPKSKTFYLKTKGEMEAAVMNMTIPNIAILRPALLTGNRNEFRFTEKIADYVFRGVNLILIGKLKKYRSISSVTVSKAMLNIAKGEIPDKVIIESDEITLIADKSD